MKLTKSKLREMIEQELKEYTGTAGGTTALKTIAAKAAARLAAFKTRSTKLGTYFAKYVFIFSENASPHLDSQNTFWALGLKCIFERNSL